MHAWTSPDPEKQPSYLFLLFSFSRGWYPNSNKSGPPGQSVYFSSKCLPYNDHNVNTLLFNSRVYLGQRTSRSVSTFFISKNVYFIHHVWNFRGPAVTTAKNSVYLAHGLTAFWDFFFITKFSVKFKANIRKM